MAKYDWVAIQREYVEGTNKNGRVHWPTMSEIADHHGIDARRIRARAGVGEWTRLRREFVAKTEKASQELRTTAIAKDAAEFDRRAFEVALNGLAHIAKKLDDDPTAIELAAIARALLGFQTAGKAALGLTDASTAAPGTITIRWLNHDPTAVDYD